MNFLELINARHSCRAFENTPIESEKWHALSEAIRKAPSAGNLQAYAVKVVVEYRKKSALATCAYGQLFLAEAPIVLVFFAVPFLSADKYGNRGAELYSIQDATIACTYAQLAAVELGLDSCWIGAFDEARVRQVMDALFVWKPVAILPIGYATSKTSLTSPPKINRIKDI